MLVRLVLAFGNYNILRKIVAGGVLGLFYGINTVNKSILETINKKHRLSIDTDQLYVSIWFSRKLWDNESRKKVLEELGVSSFRDALRLDERKLADMLLETLPTGIKKEILKKDPMGHIRGDMIEVLDTIRNLEEIEVSESDLFPVA